MKRNKMYVTFIISSIILNVLALFPSHAEAATSSREIRSQTYTTRYRDDDEGGFRESSSLRRKMNELDDDPVENLKVPILFGIGLSNLDDTWGDARSNGRTHEGIDILAPRRSFIVSPTEAVVTRIGEGGNGGKYVYTANPGGERFYFAHLDGYPEDLDEGDVLEPGDLIGYVGNTGNAAGGPTHLHLGISDEDRDPINPFPRLTREFTLKEKMEAFENILDTEDDPEELAAATVIQYRSQFLQAQAQGISLPRMVADLLKQQEVNRLQSVTRDLTTGSKGADVIWLQEFLITLNLGPAAKILGQSPVDGVFGPKTRAALAEYQTLLNINPAKGRGYFDSVTREQMKLIAAILRI